MSPNVICDEGFAKPIGDASVSKPYQISVVWIAVMELYYIRVYYNNYGKCCYRIKVNLQTAAAKFRDHRQLSRRKDIEILDLVKPFQRS